MVGPEGVGAVRLFRTGRVRSRERVVTVTPNETFSYELISGLQKLETASKRLPMAATPSTAHLFIIKPRTGSWFQSMWSTHPATEDRIRRLQEMR